MRITQSDMDDVAPAIFADWLAALEARHLADLRVPEVTRALRALSAAYVERRRPGPQGAVHGTLDSAGKRAAFALFYAPLHFLTTYFAVLKYGAEQPAPSHILDLGCGTGAAGAAWAVAASSSPQVTGIDRHPWVVDEARRTYKDCGVDGRARQGDITRIPMPRPGGAVVAAYLLNELPEATRRQVEDRLLTAASQGVRVLVLEPIARGVTPWWEGAASRVAAAGGRADQFRFPVELPPMLRLFDKAAGLNHRELTVRTLYCPGHGG
jgi:SAM-dependent methyltransferase